MLKEDYAGFCYILAEMRCGESFGETFTCTSPLLSPVAFQAAETCTVYLFSFRKILETHSLRYVFHHLPIENMVRLMAQKNQPLLQKLEILSQKSIRGRLLTYLLQLSEAQRSRRLDVPLNRTELALYLSVDRSALLREIHRLTDERHVQTQSCVSLLQSPRRAASDCSYSILQKETDCMLHLQHRSVSLSIAAHPHSQCQ